jgi:hypothetical protein
MKLELDAAAMVFWYNLSRKQRNNSQKLGLKDSYDVVQPQVGQIFNILNSNMIITSLGHVMTIRKRRGE